MCLLVGGIVTLVRQRLDAPQEEAALSLLTPFAAFLLANAIDCSGVVAVLVSALVLAYVSPRVIRARSRLVSFAFWDIATFLINGSLWVFVGVQLPGAVRGISRVDGGVQHDRHADRHPAVAVAAGRNFIAARIVIAMKSTSSTHCAIWNGGSDPAGASAWSAGTFRKS